MKIKFHGAASCVTGSCHHIILNSGKEYLVDCGMFQGGERSERKNLEDFTFDASKIEAVFLTHSHIDHSGLLPKLYLKGFSGKIYTTAPSKDICSLLFKDSANIQLSQYLQTGRLPAYEREDAVGCMDLFEAVKYDTEIDLGEIKFIFKDAGHILGSSIVEIFAEGKKLVFSGDLGNYPVPIVRHPKFIDEADYVFIETTYGGIIHEDSKNRLQKLKQIIYNVYNNKSTLLIPSFSLERTQELLFEINHMVENGEIAPFPVFLDSPLSIKITNVFRKYERLYDKETMAIIKSGDDIFKFEGLKFTETVQESKKINSINGPKIIIAGSGMCTGGRILKHLKRYVEDPNNYLLFIGYQVEGTLGRALYEMEEKVMIEGSYYNRNIQVKAIGGYSAHTDQPKTMAWIRHFSKRPKKIFLIHGERHKAEFLQNAIKDEFNIESYIPEIEDEIEI
ncbi:MBL fold metallo-hydrolase [Patescibacteria group bacterium]|nr:MBL fold metallo-hydrolase [Patescibacteria group bacterium]